jgi:hypothetical protein
MSYPSRNLILCGLALFLLLTMGVSPAFAKPQAASGDTNSDTTKKPKKSHKKSKATEPVAEPASVAPARTPGASTPEANPTNTSPASTTADAPKKIKTASGNSSPEVAAAQASGKVWVNLDSGIYHKGGRWYGKTKSGKFMTEAEAKAAGYKESRRN